MKLYIIYLKYFLLILPSVIYSDSYAHRHQIRSGLSQNPQVSEKFIKVVTKMVDKQENKVLRLVPGTSISLPEKQQGKFVS